VLKWFTPKSAATVTDSPASPTGPFAGAMPDAWTDIDRFL
jgi:hypothetical protein